MAHATRLEFFKKWAAEKVLVIGTHFATPTAGHIIDKGGKFELDVGKEGARIAAEGATRL